MILAEFLCICVYLYLKTHTKINNDVGYSD